MKNDLHTFWIILLEVLKFTKMNDNEKIPKLKPELMLQDLAVLRKDFLPLGIVRLPRKFANGIHCF